MIEYEIRDLGLLDLRKEDLPDPTLIETHLAWLAKESQSHNLTRVPRESWWDRHVLDSIAPWAAEWDPGPRFLDLGCGAGFPGIPLAASYPESRFTLLEKKKKTAAILDKFLDLSNLSNRGSALARRAEAAGRDPEHREQYRTVVTRALASLPCLIELGVPFLEREWGEMWCWKSDEDEIAASETALAELNAEIGRVLRYEIPGEKKDRSLIAIRRAGPLSDRYPRREGLPQKKPLI